MSEQDSPRAEGATSHEVFIQFLRGARIGGRYVVERILGRGGMGIVAAARHPELDQAVAIKFMWPELAANDMLNARFLREARVAAKVQSPHLVRVHDVGHLEHRGNGVPYMVMEMLAGRDLGAELRERGALPIEEAVEYILQTAVGIAEIHANGIIHRDLKPSNLFLAGSGGSRTIKVLDFGVSKETVRTTTSLTQTEHVLGTPHYMSPEQIKSSKHVDARSDIWALGIILYELLTASYPFVGESDTVGELFGLILFTEPKRPSDVRTDLPPALEQIILRCMSREPRDRFTTVGELAEALRPFTSSASLHRIEAVQRALSVGPTVPPPESIEAKITVPAGKRALPEPALERTAAEPPAYVAASAKDPASIAEAGALSVPSIGTPTEPPARRRNRFLLAAAGMVGLITLGGVAASSLRTRPSRSVEPVTSTLAVSPPTSVSALPVPSGSASAAASNTPPVMPTTVILPPSSAEHATIPATAAASAVHSVPPKVSRKVGNGASGTSAPAGSPSGGTDLLLLDRK